MKDRGVKKKKSREEWESKEREEWWHFELNRGVKSCDGSVNSKKSHILCLCLWLVSSKSRLELTAKGKKKKFYI